MSKANGSLVVKVDAKKTAKRLGLLPGGKTHRFFMDRAEFYMKQYLPARKNLSVVDAMIQGKEYNNARWVIRGLYMKYLFYGKAMAGKPKKPTGKHLVYTKSPHPKAGPFWDRQVQQNDIKKIGKEVTAFARGRHV